MFMIMLKAEYLKFCDNIEKACKDVHPKYLKKYLVNNLLIRALKIMWLQKTQNTGYVIYVTMKVTMDMLSVFHKGKIIQVVIIL